MSRAGIHQQPDDGRAEADAGGAGPLGIENWCHWILDITYREDESRIREEALRENFAWLNRFTLSLLKQHPDRTSIAMLCMVQREMEKPGCLGERCKV